MLFPNEIFVLILKFTNIESHGSLLLVCKKFKSIILSFYCDNHDLISACINGNFSNTFEDDEYYAREVLDVALEMRCTNIVRFEIIIKRSKINEAMFRYLISCDGCKYDETYIEVFELVVKSFNGIFTLDIIPHILFDEKYNDIIKICNITPLDELKVLMNEKNKYFLSKLFIGNDSDLKNIINKKYNLIIDTRSTLPHEVFVYIYCYEDDHPEYFMKAVEKYQHFNIEMINYRKFISRLVLNKIDEAKGYIKMITNNLWFQYYLIELVNFNCHELAKFMLDGYNFEITKMDIIRDDQMFILILDSKQLFDKKEFIMMMISLVSLKKLKIMLEKFKDIIDDDIVNELKRVSETSPWILRELSLERIDLLKRLNETSP